MGLVDLAIDLAGVLSASRSVASKHIALRSRQFDGYGKALGVAAGLKTPNASRQAAGNSPATAGSSEASRSGSTERGHVSTPHEPDGIEGSAQSITSARDVPHEISIVAGDSCVQETGTVSAAILQGRRKEANEQEHRSTTAPSHASLNGMAATYPTLRDLRSETEKEKRGRQVDLKWTKPADSPRIADEPTVPQGVNLEGLFRTSRGSRLSPLWKDGKQPRPVKPSVPHGVDLGVFRTSRGSGIFNELKNRPAEDTQSHSEPLATLKSIFLSQATPNEHSRPTETFSNSQITDAAARLVPSQQSQDKPDKEAPRIIDEEAASQTDTRTEKQVSEPFSKTDASELGEMLSAAAKPTYELRESRVPSSRLGRIWNYSGLAAGMFAGAISESFSRVTGGGGEGSLMLSPANMERLVAKLSKMRGAALKLGQMMSFQDSKMLPAPIQEVLQRVQDRADYMPAWQRDRVLTTNLGANWRDLFEEFEEKPIAAASIGQVHRATLKLNGARVAVKIQFPGVAESINSDLDNLGILLTATKLLPKGLYLNKTIDNARTELGWECDYKREAKCAQRYKDLLASEDDVFLVPNIYPEASGKQVLTMEFMDGVGVTRIQSFTQEQRDWIGTQVLRLCLREITEFKFMQTDPNWTNFLYDSERDRLVLLDFGASREYPNRFITLYVKLLAAASRSDRDAVKTLSEELGYLTGHESKAMLDAHIASVLTLAEPFLQSAPEVYDFRDQTITERVKAQIPVMIRERLAPPPEETYSLHRKLSGAFLLCARLGSRVKCREMFGKSVARSGILEKDL